MHTYIYTTATFLQFFLKLSKGVNYVILPSHLPEFTALLYLALNAHSSRVTPHPHFHMLCLASLWPSIITAQTTSLTYTTLTMN